MGAATGSRTRSSSQVASLSVHSHAQRTIWKEGERSAIVCQPSVLAAATVPVPTSSAAAQPVKDAKKEEKKLNPMTSIFELLCLSTGFKEFCMWETEKPQA